MQAGLPAQTVPLYLGKAGLVRSAARPGNAAVDPRQGLNAAVSCAVRCWLACGGAGWHAGLRVAGQCVDVCHCDRACVLSSGNKGFPCQAPEVMRLALSKHQALPVAAGTNLLEPRNSSCFCGIAQTWQLVILQLTAGRIWRGSSDMPSVPGANAQHTLSVTTLGQLDLA